VKKLNKELLIKELKELCAKKSLTKFEKKRQNEIELLLCTEDNLFFEKELYQEHKTLIAGVDEVGRGPLVGPVVAAAVILPPNLVIEGLTDSKKLSEKKRNYYAKIIKEQAIAYSICEVDNEEIDQINIYEATKKAMQTAIKNLKKQPEHVLIDAMKLNLDIDTTSIIKGDFKSESIAAASVLAKVYRDQLMYEMDQQYPMYDYKKNKGYPTKEHIEAVKKYGITPYYRKTYAPIKEFVLKEEK